jgi:hypothetical protein
VCTSTVAAEELAPAADVPEDADDADDAAPCEPPELQAAARTAAAAIGRPILRANEVLLDSSSLFICCAFPFGGNIERSGECLAPLNTSSPQMKFGGYAMSHITR